GDSPMAITFAKYARSGAYHWQQVDPSWGNPHYNPLLAARYRALAELTPEHSQRVLDIGCGDGYLLHLVHQQCPAAKLHGVEPEVKGLTLAREQLARHGCRAELREG